MFFYVAVRTNTIYIILYGFTVLGRSEVESLYVDYDTFRSARARAPREDLAHFQRDRAMAIKRCAMTSRLQL